MLVQRLTFSGKQVVRPNIAEESQTAASTSFCCKVGSSLSTASRRLESGESGAGAGAECGVAGRGDGELGSGHRTPQQPGSRSAGCTSRQAVRQEKATRVKGRTQSVVQWIIVNSEQNTRLT